jgi:mRNA interferase RelE/StbE
MAYEIGFKPAALRQLRKLDTNIQATILTEIERLADNPRPVGCKKLKGETNLYRIRAASSYRIVYEVQDQKLLVSVIKIGHRREVYR